MIDNDGDGDGDDDGDDDDDDDSDGEEIIDDCRATELGFGQVVYFFFR